MSHLIIKGDEKEKNIYREIYILFYYLSFSFYILVNMYIARSRILYEEMRLAYKDFEHEALSCDRVPLKFDHTLMRLGFHFIVSFIRFN